MRDLLVWSGGDTADADRPNDLVLYDNRQTPLHRHDPFDSQERLLGGGNGDSAVNQAKLQKLAMERLKDARTLLKGKRWAYAYYVTGCAVECALKSCVLARMVHTGWVFQDKARLEDCRTHDLEKLVAVAGLLKELNANLKASAVADKAFVRHWGVVLQWKFKSRYTLKQSSAAKSEAEELDRAVTHNPHGVLRWIKNYW